MQINRELTMKTQKEGLPSRARAAMPEISAKLGCFPLAGGGVWGREKLYKPISNPAPPAMSNGNGSSSAWNTLLTIVPAAIHPRVPKTRISGNQNSEFEML